MAGASMTAALKQVSRLFRDGTVLSLSDDQLLDRFLDQKDEDAFAALVARHGPMALRACLDVLRDPDDAEDAFQKTFLALVRRGGSIRGRDCVGGWLRRVAHRSALEVNADRLRRRRDPQVAAARTGSDAGSCVAGSLDRCELKQAIHSEIERLPEHYQRPVVLCLLEGLPQAVAASRLRVSEGVVRGRLARARALLRERLTRRGVAPARPAATDEPVVPAAWVGAILAAARVLDVRRLARVGWAGNAIRPFAAFLVMAGILCLAMSSPQEPESVPDPTREQAPVARPQLAAATRPMVVGDDDAGRTVVFRGKVLGPDGRPVAGARLWMVDDAWARAVERGVSNADGSYRLVLRESNFRRNFTPSSTSPRVQIALIATAEGFGPTWEQIEADARDQEARAVVDLSKAMGPASSLATLGVMKREYVHDLRLVVDRPIEGRVVDAAGKTVSGAIVGVRRIRTVARGDWKPILEEFKNLEVGNFYRGFRYVHPYTAWTMVPDATSDADGRFRLAGIGRDRMIDLHISGPGIRPAELSVMTVEGVADIARGLRENTPRGEKKPLMVFDASPVVQVTRGHTISGVVRNAKTRAPIAGMRLYLTTRPGGSNPTITDAHGRYRVTCPERASPFWLWAVSYEPDRYLSAIREFSDTKNPGETDADFDIEPGVMVTGRVVEAGTDRPIVSSPRGDCHVEGHVVAGRVEYYPLASNTALRSTPTGLYFVGPPPGGSRNVSNWIEGDGRFRLVVPPGPGVLLIRAQPGLPMMVNQLPVWEESKGFHRLFPYAAITARARDDGAGGDDPKSFPGFNGPLPISVDPAKKVINSPGYHAYKVINPPSDAEAMSVEISIPRAPSRVLRFVDLDGRPVRGVTVAGLLPRPLPMTSLDGSEAEALAFAASGPRPLIALSRDGLLFSLGVLDSADPRPMNVVLGPTSSVSGRLLDAATGRPLSGYLVTMSYSDDEERRIPVMDAPSKTDADGRFLIRGLIPRHEFSVSIHHQPEAFSFGLPEYRPESLKRLRLRVRESRDVGDVRISTRK